MICLSLLQLSTLGNLDGGGGLATIGTVRLNFIDNIKSFNNLAKDNVLAIEPGRVDGANEDWCRRNAPVFKSSRRSGGRRIGSSKLEIWDRRPHVEKKRDEYKEEENAHAKLTLAAILLYMYKNKKL